MTYHRIASPDKHAVSAHQTTKQSQYLNCIRPYIRMLWRHLALDPSLQYRISWPCLSSITALLDAKPALQLAIMGDLSMLSFELTEDT